jgi:hypothetical protein
MLRLVTPNKPIDQPHVLGPSRGLLLAPTGPRISFGAKALQQIFFLNWGSTFRFLSFECQSGHATTPPTLDPNIDGLPIYHKEMSTVAKHGHLGAC